VNLHVCLCLCLSGRICVCLSSSPPPPKTTHPPEPPVSLPLPSRVWVRAPSACPAESRSRVRSQCHSPPSCQLAHRQGVWGTSPLQGYRGRAGSPSPGPHHSDGPVHGGRGQGMGRYSRHSKEQVLDAGCFWSLLQVLLAIHCHLPMQFAHCLDWHTRTGYLPATIDGFHPQHTASPPLLSPSWHPYLYGLSGALALICAASTLPPPPLPPPPQKPPPRPTKIKTAAATRVGKQPATFRCHQAPALILQHPPTLPHLNGPPAAFDLPLCCLQVQRLHEVPQLQPQHPLNNVNMTIHHLSDAVLNLAGGGGVRWTTLRHG
jgi:hypothetical protein